MNIKLQPGDAALVFRKDKDEASVHEAYMSAEMSDPNMWVLFFSWMASDEAGEDALVGPLISDLRRAFAVRMEKGDPRLMRFFESHKQVQPDDDEEKSDDGKH